MYGAGKRQFGRTLMIPSFQEPQTMTYEMPATIPALILFHALCRDQVMCTKYGKVSMFPCTIYRSTADLTQGEGGYPVLALFRPHLTTIVTRMFSAARQAVDRMTLSTYFSHTECPFEWSEDNVLVTMSGVEPFNHKYQRKDHGFFLMSAHWFDVMKCFFVYQDCTLRDIGDIFCSVYPAWTHKFTREFRVIWLGDERDISVMDILKECGQGHTKSMTRARAANGEIRIGRNGPLWSLPVCGSIKDQLAVYDDHSMVYGAQCWDHTLQWLNTAFEYFTGYNITNDEFGQKRLLHMNGLMFLDRTTHIVDRATSILNGLHSDMPKKAVTDKIRSTRRKLSEQYGEHFSTNFFGNHFKTCYKKIGTETVSNY